MRNPSVFSFIPKTNPYLIKLERRVNIALNILRFSLIGASVNILAFVAVAEILSKVRHPIFVIMGLVELAFIFLTVTSCILHSVFERNYNKTSLLDKSMYHYLIDLDEDPDIVKLVCDEFKELGL